VDEGLPAVLGRCAADGDRLRFTPRFPFVPGLAYRVRVHLRVVGMESASGREVVEARVQLRAASPRPTTVVTAVYPSAAVLPENQLKLYVHFSAPMRESEAASAVRLLEEPSGRPVESPFAEGGQELWDRERRRLTLLLDPGRIKRGLVGNRQAGPPLREGASYRLEIASTWRDASGLPLATGFVKRFRVGAADRAQPDPASWRLAAPAAGTRRPVTLDFPEPLDHALLQRAIAVRREGAGRVEGRIIARDDERRWELAPEQPWVPGRYTIVIDPVLEDLAGNNLRRLFDREGTAPSAAPQDEITLPFECVAQGR
jgi:hypothetical protein